MGVSVEGRFRTFTANISLDPKKPDSGKVQFSIDTASATLGLKETDAELLKADWFNTAKFPRASFQSTAIRALGGGRFEVVGTLGIKGQAREVRIPVVLTQSTGASVATGSFVLKRLDFGIGSGEWGDPSLVANEVQVQFKLTLSGLAPL